MKVFFARPLAFAICIAVLICALSVSLPAQGRLLLLLLCGLFLVLTLGYAVRKKRCGKGLSLILLSLLATALLLTPSYLFFNRELPRFEAEAQNGCKAQGYVLERQSAGAYETRLLVQFTELNGSRTSQRVLLKCDYPSSLQIGDCFRLQGVWEAPQVTDLYDERAMLLSDGCVGILRLSSSDACQVLPEPESNLAVLLKKWNAGLSARLQASVGGEDGALACALLLGNRSFLSEDTVLDFRRAGVSHLLALSGMHISVLILMLERLLAMLRLPRSLRVILTLAAGLFYLGLTGASLSTARAVLMVGVLSLGFFTQEDYDSFTSLSFALFLILLCMPYAVYDVGMWLSFVATASIVVFLPAVFSLCVSIGRQGRLPNILKRPLCRIMMALSVGAFANVGILLCSLLFTGTASLWSLPVTLLLSPVLSAALPLSLAVLLLAGCPFLAQLLRACLRGMLWLTSRVSDIPNGTVRLDGAVTVLLIILVTALLAWLAVRNIRRKGWLLLPILLVPAVMLSGFLDALPRSKGVAFSFYSQKGNDAIILTEGRRTVAWDLSSGTGATEAAILANAPLDRYTELDELILSHYHPQLSYVISSLAGRIKLNSIRLPSPLTAEEEAIAARLAQEAELHGITTLWGTDDTAIPSVQVLCHERILQGSEAAVILSLSVNGHTVTYLGEGCTNREGAIPSAFAADRAETVILGAHGYSLASAQLPALSQATRVVLASELSWQGARPHLPPHLPITVGSCRFFF